MTIIKLTGGDELRHETGVYSWSIPESVRIVADDEYNAIEFWAELDDCFGTIADSIRREGFAWVTPLDWLAIQQLDGFADGPKHARTALMEESE